MVFFDIAAYWHKIYALYVEAVLKYAATSAETVDVVHDGAWCYLGRWLEGRGRQYSSLPEFQSLHVAHDKFHQVASAAIDAANQKQVSTVTLNQTVDTLRDTSFAVIAAVAELDSVVAEQVENSEALPVKPSDPMECPVGKYKLGISVIDDQHQALAALATRLMENPSTQFSDQDNAELIRELALLTDLHFKTEELYMRSIQLPALELQKHVAAHQRILDNLSSLSSNAGSLELLTVGDVIPKFAHWFSGHLIDYDYSLKKF